MAANADQKQETARRSYGTMSRTLSAQGLSEVGIGLMDRLKGMGLRADSFADLPMVALPGLTSRVSISGSTSASQQDLSAFFLRTTFTNDPFDTDVPAVQVVGGSTPALLLSTAGALASSFMFGLNNANMNTPAAVMREALGLPAKLADGCVADEQLQASLTQNSLTWSFVVSVLCLSALLGSAAAGGLADRVGRRAFLLGNTGLYVLAALLCCLAALPCANAPPADPCSPTPNIPAVLLLLAGRRVAQRQFRRVRTVPGGLPAHGRSERSSHPGNPSPNRRSHAPSNASGRSPRRWSRVRRFDRGGAHVPGRDRTSAPARHARLGIV